jgi:hypothetical protein
MFKTKRTTRAEPEDHSLRNAGLENSSSGGTPYQNLVSTYRQTQQILLARSSHDTRFGHY